MPISRKPPIANIIAVYGPEEDKERYIFTKSLNEKSQGGQPQSHYAYRRYKRNGYDVCNILKITPDICDAVRNKKSIIFIGGYECKRHLSLLGNEMTKRKVLSRLRPRKLKRY